MLNRELTRILGEMLDLAIQGKKDRIKKLNRRFNCLFERVYGHNLEDYNTEKSLLDRIRQSCYFAVYGITTCREFCLKDAFRNYVKIRRLV